MQLTDEQKELLAGLTEDWKCPVCSSEEFGLVDRVFELREYHGGKLKLSGPTFIFPVIPVSCGDCGHILFFSAIQLGLVEPIETDEDAEEELAPEEEE